MTLYSYIVTHDTGFSPNPFFGHCTLACCKPDIRRKAKVGDWVVGLTPKADGNRVVFFMQIDDVKGFDRYWNDRKFDRKKPRCDAGIPRKCGDNAYEPKPSARGGYRQLPCMHSDGRHENEKKKKRDLSGKQVLISRTFAYFGSRSRGLPPELSSLIVGRAHRCRFPDEVKEAFLRFAGEIRSGVYAGPRKWPPGDDSWKRAAAPWLIKR